MSRAEYTGEPDRFHPPPASRASAVWAGGQRAEARRRPQRPLAVDADRGAREQTWITSCQGLVRSVAWSIHQGLPPHVDLDDLIGYGQVGLAEAAREFDPDRGAKFSTYAFYRVRGAILDGLSKMSWFSRADYYARRYERLSNDVLALCEIDADAGPSSVEDGAAWLGDVSRALAVISLAKAGGDDEKGSKADNLADDRNAGPSGDVIWRELCSKLHELIATLPGDGGKLIRQCYFQGLSLQEAARRLGISKSWASRLHARMLDRLARGLRLLELAD